MSEYKQLRTYMKEVILRSLATDKGLKNYFTGVPCVNGHISERDTKHCYCIECNRIKAAKQYKEDPEKCKEATRKRHLDTNGESQRKYRLKKRNETKIINELENK
ncbi:MAG TPA: hypothetical protein EYN67_05105 [Flavobacteriales bacterium]|nr:hypothetical protein [Methylococcaceae bacterium]HHZ94936.1 hypothetical protein [Flavobacteriales bacterium]